MAYTEIESPVNYEQKCLCVFVLDVSSSMEGAPINELNEGLRKFHQEIKNDSTTANRLEVAIVSFSDKIDVVQNPALVDQFDMPVLYSSGTTKLVWGVEKAISILKERKQYYKDTGIPYYRPWIILISDGAPDSDQNIDILSSQIKTDAGAKGYVFFPVGVTNADMNVLGKLCAEPISSPSMLNGLEFGKFFKWLSSSFTKVVNSKEGDKIDFDDPSDWTKGFKV